MYPSTCRLIVFATVTASGSSGPSASAGRCSWARAFAIRWVSHSPSGCRSGLRMSATKIGNAVPACVRSRFFRPSIQIRFMYQSLSSAAMSAAAATPSRPAALAVHRRITTTNNHRSESVHPLTRHPLTRHFVSGPHFGPHPVIVLDPGSRPMGWREATSTTAKCSIQTCGRFMSTQSIASADRLRTTRKSSRASTER